MDHDHHEQTGPYNWSTWAPPAATKRKPEPYESWEERAFAEDAAGVLGSSGCVWPPRSYTCSFCRREFRSAQALGGHMNVHRRDRARLKQLPNTPQPPPPLPPITPFLKPNYKTTFVYGTSTSTSPNPNINPSSMQSLPNYAKNEAKIIEVECRDLEEHTTKCADSELSISLNLVVRRNRREEEDRCFKRRKIIATSSEASPPLILLSKGGEVGHKSEINVGSSKEIDLELRLGG